MVCLRKHLLLGLLFLLLVGQRVNVRVCSQIETTNCHVRFFCKLRVNDNVVMTFLVCSDLRFFLESNLHTLRRNSLFPGPVVEIQVWSWRRDSVSCYVIFLDWDAFWVDAAYSENLLASELDLLANDQSCFHAAELKVKRFVRFCGHLRQKLLSVNP